MKKNKIKKAFTLIETIVAVSLLASGILVLYGSAARLIYWATENSTHFTASYLAQEGIEIVRNIRDSNWVEDDEISGSIPWNDGLGAGTYYAQYDDAELTAAAEGDIPNLEVNDNGRYGYETLGLPGPGIDTSNYKRVIEINTQTDILEIICTVSWGESSVEIEENLYNWHD